MSDLDRQVATQIMGWIYDEHYGVHTHAGIPEPHGGYRDQHRNYVARECWSPSTDFIAAFQVVDRMQEKGLYWSGGHVAGMWAFYAAFWDGKDGGTAYLLDHSTRTAKGHVQAETLPKAICLAALAAVKEPA